MSIQLGQVAPDFEQDTTVGRIAFHQWLGDSWGVLFSHPKDFTPVCATELGEVARMEPEFDRRVKVIGLSVDSLGNHARWNDDIADVMGSAIDPDKKLRLLLTCPPSAGRNFPEILRVVDSLQLTDAQRVATPVNWQPGDRAIIVPSVSDDDARKQFPQGWEAKKPYLRFVDVGGAGT